MKLKRKDRYLEKPPMQPKAEIGRYVKQNGILVPEIYDSYSDAKKSGKEIIARSEHQNEYNGASGLFESICSDNCELFDAKNEKTFRKNALENESLDFECVARKYCNYLGINITEFKNDFSYSFWEYLEGINHAIVADSSIRGRYHIMSREKKPKSKNYYTLIENGTVLGYNSLPLAKQTPKLIRMVKELIETYEKIRNLENFNPIHCPIIEFQTFNDKNYFLQYHRTIDFCPADFILEQAPFKNLIKADFARGATSKDGIELKIIIATGGDKLRKKEDGTIHFSFAGMYSELMVRKKIINFFPNSPGKLLEETLWDFAYGHASRSQMFKPKVSIITDLYKLISKEEYNKAFEEAFEGKNTQKFRFFVISDGNLAFFQRIE